MVTLKFPSVPSTLSTSAQVIRLMLRCRPTSTSLGEIIHIAQSLVGNVLSSSLITPPMADDFSTI
jgi:hypothetical protein